MVRTRSATGSLPPPRLRSLRDVEDELEDERDQLHEALFKPLKRWRETGEPPADYVEERLEWLHDSVMSSFSSRVCQAVCCKKAKDKLKEEEEQPTTRKQRRRNTKNDGRLSLLFTMPLDIICEVASYLSPLDVLHLARTGRIIRNFLLSKSSKPVWRAARNSINMPDCPNDLSEPQYISLVLETDCNVCGAPNIQRIDYTLRVRLCRGCFRENVVRGSELVKELPKAYARDWLMFILVPFYDFWLGADTSHRLVSIDYLQQRYFKPDFMEITRKYIQLSGEPDRQAHFVVQRVKANIHAAINAKALGAWFREVERMKHAEDRIRSTNRQQQILSRLAECGFTSEQFPQGRDDLAHRWAMILSAPHEITPRNWKNVRPQLESMINITRIERVEKARKARLLLRQKELRAFYIAYLVDLETNRSERAKYWWLKTEPGIREDSEQGGKRWEEQRRLERLSLPNFGDLRSIPLVKLLLEEEDGYLRFTKSKWDTVREILPDEATRLYNRMLDDYEAVVIRTRERVETVDAFGVGKEKSSAFAKDLSVVPSGKGKEKASVPDNNADSDLEIVPIALRPSSFFTCLRQGLCRQPAAMPFPEILGGRHYCCIAGEQMAEAWLHFFDGDVDLEINGNDGTANAVEPPWASWVRYKPRCVPWKEGLLGCSVQAMTVAEALLKELGLRSEQTSMADLVELGNAFKCTRCLGAEPMTWVELVTHYCAELGWNSRAQERLEKYKTRLAHDVLGILPKEPKIVNDHAFLPSHAGRTQEIAERSLVRFLPSVIGSSSHLQEIGVSSGLSVHPSPSSQELLIALMKTLEKQGALTTPHSIACKTERPSLPPNCVNDSWTVPDDKMSDADGRVTAAPDSDEGKGSSVSLPYEPEFLTKITTNNVRCGLCDLINLGPQLCNGKALGKHIYSKHGKAPEPGDVLGPGFIF